MDLKFWVENLQRARPSIKYIFLTYLGLGTVSSLRSRFTDLAPTRETPFVRKITALIGL